MRKVVRLAIVSSLLWGVANVGPTLGVAAAAGQCREEIQQLCGNVPRGQGERRACIQENLSKLSPACQERVQKRMEKRLQRRIEQGEKSDTQ